MVEVHVKFESNGAWVASKLEITNDHITLKAPYNCDVPYRFITDVIQENQMNQILTIVATLESSKESLFRIRSVEKTITVLQKLILLSCNTYRTMAYFMIPTMCDGVLATDAKWKKGAVTVLKTGIWFICHDTQVCVPLSDVVGFELTKCKVQKKEVNVIKFDYADRHHGSEVVTGFISSPLSMLQALFNFIQNATKDKDIMVYELARLNDQAAQVAMLVYSGVNSRDIEEMLTLSSQELDDIYTILLKLHLAEVVLVRKELRLTPKGVRHVSETVKPLS
jgi:helix-turn-helix protein